MNFTSWYRPSLARTIAALLLGIGAAPAPAQAQPAPDVYRPYLPPSIAQSAALRAFTVAPFADADIKPGETLLSGAFVISTDPQSLTIRVTSSTSAKGVTKEFDPPAARQIQLRAGVALWAGSKKRASIDWEKQVLDYAPVLVVGTEGAAGQPFVARKVEIVDGYIGDLLKDPEFQQQLQQVQSAQALQQTILKGQLPPHSMWLENLDLGQMTTGYGQPQSGKSVGNNALRLGGVTFSHGIGTHAESDFVVDLKGKATRFAAIVGVDEEIGSRGSVVFSVWVDGRKVEGSTIMRVGDDPELVTADLTGAKTLRLQVSDAGDSVNSDHADWAGAFLEFVPATDLGNPSSRPNPVKYAGASIPPPVGEDVLRAQDAPPDVIWLESLDLQKMSAGYSRPLPGRSIGDNPLRMSGVTYPHGVGTHASSRMMIDLNGTATRFMAMVGVDEEIGVIGSVEFSVWVDGQEMANTGVIKAGQPPQLLSVNLTGASTLELRAEDGEDGINSDHADWGGALIQLVPGTGKNEAPVAIDEDEKKAEMKF